MPALACNYVKVSRNKKRTSFLKQQVLFLDTINVNKNRSTVLKSLRDASEPGPVVSGPGGGLARVWADLQRMPARGAHVAPDLPEREENVIS